MSDERLLGQIIAEQKHLHEDVKEIKQDVKSLNEFRWKWVGKMAAYTGLVAFVVSLLTALWTIK